MAKLPIIQQSFAGGEITDALQSRKDLAKQNIGLLTCRNAILTSTGSWKNRGSLKYIAEVEDSSKQHRLMPFVFSREQAYCLVWGDLILRIIKDGAVVESGGSPVDIVTPYLASNNADLYTSQSADVMSIAHPTIKPYNLTRTSDIAWTLTAIDFQDGPYIAFKEGDQDITLTPSADGGAGVTIIASAARFGSVGVNDHIRLGYVNPLDISQIYWAWAKVTAVASSTSITVTSQELFGFEYFLNPEFLDGIGFWENHSTATGDATVEHVAATQELRFIRSATPHDAIIRNNVAVAANEDLILSLVVTQVDTSFRVFVGTTAGAADILGVQIVNSTGQKSWTVRPTQSSIWITIDTTSQPSGTHKISRASLKRKDLATQYHRLGAWNSDRGWPHVVTRNEQRTIWGGGHLDYPDTIWCSELGEYERFGFHTPLLDTDGITFTLDSRQVDAINFMIAHGELIVGTDSSEWRIMPGNVSNTITPTSLDAKVKSDVGGASVKPLIAGSSVLFMNRTQNKVFAIAYSYDSDSFKPVDLTVLAPHLFEDYTMTEWAYQKTPDSIVWIIRSDGKLLGLSWIEEQEIWAWSLHDTAGLFESVAVVPDSGVDTAYFIVNRTIGGATKRYIEKLMPRIVDESIFDYGMVDSCLIWNLPKTITNASKTNPVVIDSTGHGFNDGDRIKIDGVNGMTELNGKYYLVNNKTANDYELQDLAGVDVDGTGYTAYVSGGAARWAVIAITGLGHLEGETVVALSDGSVNTQKTVSSGAIALDNHGGVVYTGLPFTSDLKTMPHEAIGGNGFSTQGRYKSLVGINAYFNKTRGAHVGSSEDDLIKLSFKDDDSGDAPPFLFTGVKAQIFDDSSSRKLVSTFIRNTDPVPIEVVGIISEVDFSDDLYGDVDDN